MLPLWQVYAVPGRVEAAPRRRPLAAGPRGRAQDEGALRVGLEAPVVAAVEGVEGESLADQGLGPGGRETLKEGSKSA